MPKFTEYPQISGTDGTELFLVVKDNQTQGIKVDDVKGFISNNITDTTSLTVAQSAFGQANTANTRAIGAFNQANSAVSQAALGRGTGNTALVTAQAAFGQANNGAPDILARTTANTALSTSTVAFGQSNLARTTANTALSTSTGAFTAANGKISLSGGELDGFWYHEEYDYGSLSTGNIQLNPSNGLAGKIIRNTSNNAILAPTGTPSGIYTMVIFIDGTSSSGVPTLSGFSNIDFGDDMPGNNQHALLYITCGPSFKVAKIEAIDY